MPVPSAPALALARARPQSLQSSPDKSALPSLTSVTLPAMRLLLPMKSAANKVWGMLYISCGVPCCSMTPLLRRRILSDIAMASFWSCVTTSAESCRVTMSWRSHARASSRSLASRLESGSSIRITGGL